MLASGGHAAARCCARSATTARDNVAIRARSSDGQSKMKVLKLSIHDELVHDVKTKFVELCTGYNITLELNS